MSEQRAGRQRHSLAVVIIHGIGEQRPMDTLRGFVQSVLSVPKQGGEKYYSRPDPLTESFELRVLQNREQPRPAPKSKDPTKELGYINPWVWPKHWTP